MPTYTYSSGLVVDSQTMTIVVSATGDFYDSPTGSVQEVTDLDDVPFTNISTNSSGFFPPFKTATGPSTGWIKFGSYWHAVTSLEAQDATAAVTSAATAATAAQDAADDAAAAAAIAQAQPGMLTVVQDVDDSWPDRRTVTTDRTRVVGWLYRNPSESTWPTRKAVGATGGDLVDPTPADMFLPYASPLVAGTNQIVWSGHLWDVRIASGGPQYNSEWHAGASVEAGGILHLKTGVSPVAGVQIQSVQEGFGYGKYSFELATNYPATIFPQVILGLFIYDTDLTPSHNEIDIEVAGWGWDSPAKLDLNYFYPTSPSVSVAALVNKSVILDVDHPVYSFEWRPTYIKWEAPGDLSVTATDGAAYSYEWSGTTYTGTHDIPVPNNEQVILNMWVTAGGSGTWDEADTPVTEVFIRSFSFEPYVAP